MDFMDINQVKQDKVNHSKVMKQINQLDDIGYGMKGVYYADIIGIEYHKCMGCGYHYDLTFVSTQGYKNWIHCVIYWVNVWDELCAKHLLCSRLKDLVNEINNLKQR